MSDDELTAMAGDDPAVARVLRAGLERLRDGVAGDEMRDIARDVLDGHASLRELGKLSIYGSAFSTQLANLAEWRQEIGEDEYQRQMNLANEGLDQIRESIRERGQG